MKNRLKAKGMKKRALRLLKSYLDKRFIQVVASGGVSSLKEIFSGVPQGTKWSPSLWDFDISEMADSLSEDVLFFGYADDVAMWYEISPQNRSTIISTINADLHAMQQWGDDNKTSFEHSKTYYVVFSKKKRPFDTSDIRFEGQVVAKAEGADAKVVGYVLDPKMTWGQMIDQIARKAKGRLAALARVKHLLNSSNLKRLYCMFIRSIMEYGSLAWGGAARVHLEKLDRIQGSPGDAHVWLPGRGAAI